MVTVTRLNAIDRERFRRLLVESRYRLGPGQRPGFVPFNAHLLMTKIAREQSATRRVVALKLGRWAKELGGELVEGEVLWLPEDLVGDLRLDERKR